MKEKTDNQWIIIVILFVVIICGYFTGQSQQNFIDTVYKEIKKQNIKHPDIVLKQCIKETGWFKCKVCSWQYNNPFGFRHKSKITESNPGGYYAFKDWKESIKFYAGWQERKYPGGDYYKFLKDVGYATDPDYVKDLKLIVYEPE